MKNKCTKKEIEGQPRLWRKVFDFITLKEDGINSFLSPLLKNPQLQIILSGAGSSAFIGEAAQGLIQQSTGLITRAIPTTDIVTHPDLFLSLNRPMLFVSFARSGNSPESVESLKLVDEYYLDAHHLIISCNDDGELVRYAKKHSTKAYALVLPEEAHDKSLAMTGSFTSMLLAVLLIFRRGQLKSFHDSLINICEQANQVLKYQHYFDSIAKKDFERVVFLGSGPMLGIARECHLKLQELTDGKIICKYDSFLGFRHGPRAVINEKTLMVYLFSQDDHIYKYELDLAVSISKDKTACITAGRVREKQLAPYFNVDFNLELSGNLCIIPFTMIGQLLGLYKSLQLGLDPDNPSISGAISRVVEGVVIYDHP